MKAFVRAALTLAGVWQGAGLAQAATANGGDTIAVQDMTLTVPDGWSLKQDAKDAGTIILGFQSGDEYVTLYVKQARGLDMRQLFANGAQVVRDVTSLPRGSHTWKLLETSKAFAAHNKTYYVASFLTEVNGFSYYGYSRSTSSAKAMENVSGFLQDLR